MQKMMMTLMNEQVSLFLVINYYEISKISNIHIAKSSEQCLCKFISTKQSVHTTLFLFFFY